MSRSRIAFFLLLFSGLTSQLQAQEYRVYTRVFQMQDSKEVPVSRSLSLFRSGKSYDYIDSLGEVIFFDPANKEFTILNLNRDLKTTVQFDQLMHQIDIARKTTREYAEKLETSRGSKNKLQADKLFFQLKPNFKIDLSSKNKEIKLSSPGLNYQAKGTNADPAIVKSYLKYADWMCRLNYVMHPNPFLPECRISLNRELGKLELLPLQVEFMADMKPVLKLRAEHRIQYHLSKQDLSQIHTWETALKKQTTRHVTFKKYQEAIIVSQLDK